MTEVGIAPWTRGDDSVDWLRAVTGALRERSSPTCDIWEISLVKKLSNLCALVMSAAVVALLGAACGAPTSFAAPPPTPHLRQFVKQGVVRVCSTGDYRPFTYYNPQGQWSGMDIEMAQDMAKRLGVKLDLLQTTWGTMMKDLGTRCDMVMGGVSITPDRAEQALYSSPYLHDGKAAMVRCADRSKFGSLADIDRPGVRVVVNPGGTNAAFDMANIHHATIVSYPDNNSILGQLTAGKADVMITDTSEIRWQTKQNPQLCAVAVDHPFTSEQKAYLIPRDDPILQRWVDEWLNIAQHDGTYARISEQWMGQVIGP
jgi:cyclohexadienyl dehydratase